MNKALYKIANELSQDNSILKKSTRDIQLIITRKLKPYGLKGKVPYTDVILASTMVIKKCQEAPSNMARTMSTRNYYAVMPSKYYKD